MEQVNTLQQQLKEQEKLASLGMLSAGIAHEIQNPLNFVINFSKLSVKLVQDLERPGRRYHPKHPAGLERKGRRVSAYGRLPDSQRVCLAVLPRFACQAPGVQHQHPRGV